MSAPTLEHASMLAAIERSHGKVDRVPDDTPMADDLLCQSVTDTRVYRCRNCELVFTIEPDGSCTVWALELMETPTEED